MSGHPQSEEWMRLLDGEVTTNREAALRAHAEACASCRREVERLESLFAGLREPLSAPDPGATERVMSALDRHAAPPSRGRRHLLAGTAAALAAAGLFFVFWPRGGGGDRRDPGAFQARGGGTGGDPIARRAGVRFHALPRTSALETGDTLAADAGLFASYTNRTDRTLYALVFAVDASNTIHWLYPGYTDPGTDPAAVPLRAGEQDHAFEESVVLEAPAPGEMLLVSIIARERRSVSAVEGISRSARTLAGLRRRFPDANVRAVRVEVGP